MGLPFCLLAEQKLVTRLGDLLRAAMPGCGTHPRRVVLLDDPADRVAARLGTPGGWRVEIVLPETVQ